MPSRALKIRTDDDALKEVTVTITASTSGSSAADPSIVGGRLVSCFASAGAAQVMVSAVLNADGSVTVTIAGSDTATYTCIVQKN